MLVLSPDICQLFLYFIFVELLHLQKSYIMLNLADCMNVKQQVSIYCTVMKM